MLESAFKIICTECRRPELNVDETVVSTSQRYLFSERMVKIASLLSLSLNCWGIVVLLFVFLLPNVLNSANTHQLLLLWNI